MVSLVIFVSGCAMETPPPATSTVQPTLPPPQVFVTPLPQEMTLTPTQLQVPSPTLPVQITPGTAEFGVEIHDLGVDFANIQALGARWVRYNGILWSEVEPLEGVFDWGRLAKFEEGARKAQEAGLKLIVVVRGTPVWAQKVYGYYCGQIQAVRLGNFSNFLTQLETRYSPAPFNVHYWELWNEPDVAPEQVSPISPYGCLGDLTDPYYGGGAYAEMLRAVVPAMRATDPMVKVLMGGLLLDCDPTDPGQPGRCNQGSELPPRFVEGILRAGGGEWVDFMSFHAYSFFALSMYSPVYSEMNLATWQARGGVVDGKISYLADLMTAYNVQLPLFMTETAFLCRENLVYCGPVGPEFLQKQAEYGSWLAVRNYAENINTIWYTFEGPGWRNGGLLDKDQNPRPVYAAIQFALRKISNSAAVRKITEYPGIRGYEFQSPQGKFYFLAPIAETPPVWTLPENAASYSDVFGQPVSPETLSPLTAPVFVDLH